MGEETPVQSTEQPPQTEISTKEVSSVETVQAEAKPSSEVEAVALSVSDDVVEVISQETQPQAAFAVSFIETEPKPISAIVMDTGITYERRADGMPQFMYDAVGRIAPQEGFTPGQFVINFESGSGKGDGFGADMFRASISEGDRKLVVLCKIPPINDARRQNFGSMPIFDREVQAYSRFLPIMYEFQREKGVTEEMGVGFFNAPQCYLAYLDEAKEESVIIMDDLRLKDHRMWNKMVPVDYEHARLLMVQLGRLHAVSLALKDQRPDVFEQFKAPELLSKMMKANPGLAEMLTFAMERAIGILEPHEEMTRQKLLKLKDTMLDDLQTILHPDYAEPYSVLTHGDCWINNMIYSYKRGKPTGIVILDWQMCSYASPATDLLYFIFGGTDEDFRRQHYDELIRIYHGSLRQLLEKLGGNVTRQFPYTALLRQLKACGKFITIMAVFMIQMLSIENQDLPDIDEAAEQYKDSQTFASAFVINEKSEAKYKKRMGAVLRDLIRYGYL